MILRTFKQLYGSRPITFEIPGPPEAALQTLSQHVRSTWSMAPRDGLVGWVSLDRVELQRREMFFHNGFRPWFIGRFESNGRTTRLVGVYRMGLMTRAFMSVWFGFLLLWLTVVTIFAAFTAWREPTNLIFPAAGSFILLFGIWLVGYGSAKGAEDEAFIASLLLEQLRAVPT
jgi:hypothetical protein